MIGIMYLQSSPDAETDSAVRHKTTVTKMI